MERDSGNYAEETVEWYVFEIYLYLINLEVSQSIHYNFNRQSTDNLPTDYQTSADMLPTVGRLSAERWLPLWKKLLANSPPTVRQQLTDSRCR